VKVLQILPELNAGGVERGTVELARFLVAEGHESIVVSHGGPLVPGLVDDGTKHHALPVHRKSLFSLRLVRVLRRLFESESPDIIHARSRAPAWLSWLAWRKMNPASRPRFVTTLHGLHSVNRFSAIMMRGERVIAVSHAARDYILKNFPVTDPAVIRVIPRGIDPVRYPHGFQPSREWEESWLRDQPQTRGRFLLTLPARLTRLKGHEEFIALVGMLREADLPVHGLIAGGAHPRKQDYEAELHDLVQSTGLGDDITFLGHRDDLREILASSDVVLSLSRKPESFGRVTLESLAMGTAVIAYAHGGVAEQLAHFLPEGAVAPGDTRAVAGLITSWLRDGTPAPVADHTYTLEETTRRTLEVYHELLAAEP
jgi:glycosyltransferase involved in cell wall biosynthesis